MRAVTARQYNYFFIFAIIIGAFFWGYYFDIKPLLIKFNETKHEKEKLHDEIYSAKLLLDRRANVQTQWQQLQNNLSRCLRAENNAEVASELLAAVLRAADTNGLQVNSIEPGVWQNNFGVNNLSMHLFIHGRFLQFLGFVSMLRLYALPIEVADFHAHADAGGELEMDLQLNGYYVSTQRVLIPAPLWMPSTTIDFYAQRDPFISIPGKIVELDNRSIDNNLLLQSVFLKQIKWVGYVANDKKFWALAKLPCGKTIEVERHTILGLEKAHVIQLSDRDIIVNLSGHQIHMFYQQ